jgi:crotonobetainyl-CoA:carnitine CoA-transferase CaiB-like acyl-CoA transferase
MKTIKPGPLSHLNVLDFTWVLAGPHSTKTLADMGASVIKIEHFKNGTNERHQALQVEKNGIVQCSYHLHLNRGKKSLCINLKHPKGIELIQGLIRKSDIIVENFAPGVMERLNLDYESVKKIKPDIIYCSISAWGHWGPNKHKPGYDAIAQAASGWIGLTSTHVGAPVAIGDTTASIHACTAMLAALVHRMITGQGQNIDISMVDCLFSVHETSFPAYWISEAVGKPFIMPRTSKKSPTSSPYGVYTGKNGSISIALLSDNRWPELVDLMGPGYEWLKTEPRTRDLAARCKSENVNLVHDALDAWVMSQNSVEEAERKLEATGIPCSRVKSIEELATTDSHIGAREMRIPMNQPFLGPVKMYGSPLKFSETPATIRGYAPFLGEHNREVLSTILGYTEEEIDTLYREDVLYQAPEVEKLPEELKKMGQKKNETDV